MVTHGEGKEDAPDVSAEDGTEYTACCVELQRKECWKKEENQRERQRRSGWQSQVETGKPCDKKGPALIGARYVSVGS
jgi:hypothetical protein